MNWRTIRRETGLIEHKCEHGVGHPNPASVLRMKFATRQSSWDIHGCDGCCARIDFPGQVYNNVVYAAELYQERDMLPYLDGCDPDVLGHLEQILDIHQSEYNLDASLQEKMRQAGMDFVKLRKYLSYQTIIWHENYRSGPEFLYWPLCQLLLTNEEDIKDWMNQ